MKIHTYLQEKLCSVYSFHTLKHKTSTPEEFKSVSFGAMMLSGYKLYLKSSQRRHCFTTLVEIITKKKKKSKEENCCYDLYFIPLVQIKAVLFRYRKEGNVFVQMEI